MFIHNFSAGPSILAPSVLDQSAAAIREFAGMGLSILEVSHRSAQFEAVVEETQSLIRELTGLDDSYDVLLLQGGASTQFFQIPHNFLGTSAAYTKTGTWISILTSWKVRTRQLPHPNPQFSALSAAPGFHLLLGCTSGDCAALAAP